ncbi:MAG: S8 family peptidase [Candidatus Kapabacteria bacterium]|nr:S8 family peptidase [Candidatus Kapabacteria bacterium]
MFENVLNSVINKQINTKKDICKDLFLIIFILAFFSHCLNAQNHYPVVTNERGNYFQFNYPPPDSAYSHNSLIVHFRKSALNLQKLTYNYDFLHDSTISLNSNNFQNLILSDSIIRAVMAQRFEIAELVNNPELAVAAKSLGGQKLRRITWANPIKDTVSISRTGTVVPCDDFLWMTMEFADKSDILAAADYLTSKFQNDLYYAKINLFYYPCKIPNDQLYKPYQTNLKSLIGMENAWNYTTGLYDIKVAIIDNGIDYYNCDLGAGTYGEGKKVSAGYHFLTNDSIFDFCSWHGTPIAGIIGAFSNGTGCSKGDSTGVAGIGGGWLPDKDSIGLQLIALKADVAQKCGGMTAYPEDYVIGSIRTASSNSPDSPYGRNLGSCHVINMSFGAPNYSEAVRAACFYAYQNDVSLVCASGNFYSYNSSNLPSNYDPSIITAVGAGDHNKNKMDYSCYSENIDFIAPGGVETTPINDQIVFSPNWNIDHRNIFDYFMGTSSAAAHVSGVIGLLRSYDLKYYKTQNYPEDYEGMLKASALDRKKGDDSTYSDNFDEITGWGHIQADKVFDMIGRQGYKIKHLELAVPKSIISYNSWSSEFNFSLNSQYYTKLSTDYASTTFTASRREVTATITLDTLLFKNTMDERLYVWGIGSHELHNLHFSGGYSAANPNYQTRYTEIVNAEGGKTSPHYVPGIALPTNTMDVKVMTYQYRIWNENAKLYEYIPDGIELGFNISVFGVPAGISQIKDKTSDKIELIKIYPNPFDNSINAEMNIEPSGEVFFEIYNLDGSYIYSKKFENYHSDKFLETIQLTGLDAGIYICKIQTEAKIYIFKLIKRG